MTTFESRAVTLNVPCNEVFSFLEDFRNLETIMPEQIENWTASESACSFSIRGLAALSMRIDSKSSGRNIHIVSDGKNPISYSMDYFFIKKSEQTCAVTVVLDADLNPFLKSIASRPLQNFVEMIADKLQELFGKA